MLVGGLLRSVDLQLTSMEVHLLAGQFLKEEVQQRKLEALLLTMEVSPSLWVEVQTV